MERTQIKICGITRECEAEYLSEAGVDYAGFVLYEKSKRYLEIPRAIEIFKKLKKDIIKVAVTVDPDEELLEEIEQAGFDVLQVHKNLRAEVQSRCTLPIWYAVNLHRQEELAECFHCRGAEVAGYVIDAPEAGSGRTFDWHAWDETRWRDGLSGKKFILAGGLTPANVAEGIRIFHPDVVDVSSGVEGVNGKNREKIIQFAEAARKAAH